MLIRRLILLVCLLMGLSMIVVAQSDDACPTIVSLALDASNLACGDVERDELCYGNIDLAATPFDHVEDFTLDQPGDTVQVADVQNLRLSSMSLTDESWGIAVMKVQANLPDSLPGQNVTFLLFGNVEIENAVDTVIELPATSTTGVNVRLRPTTNADNVIGSLHMGQEVIATGRLADHSWIRIALEEDARGTGWVSADFLRSDADLSTLTVVEPDAPIYGPMQAFYFKTGIGDAQCHESPNSGILIQTPEGARTVDLVANDVKLTVGSTVYLQTGDGYMIVSVLEGAVVLEAFGTKQHVPAGTYTRIPLDENGVASGPPTYPQPYDSEDFAALPVTTHLPESITVTEPLTEEQIDEAIAASSSPGTGTWSWAITWVEQTGPDHCLCHCMGQTWYYHPTIQMADDQSSFVVLSGDKWYCPEGQTVTQVNDNTYNIYCTWNVDWIEWDLTFTSPTTMVGTWKQGAWGVCDVDGWGTITGTYVGDD